MTTFLEDAKDKIREFRPQHEIATLSRPEGHILFFEENWIFPPPWLTKRDPGFQTRCCASDDIGGGTSTSSKTWRHRFNIKGCLVPICGGIILQRGNTDPERTFT